MTEIWKLDGMMLGKRSKEGEFSCCFGVDFNNNCHYGFLPIVPSSARIARLEDEREQRLEEERERRLMEKRKRMKG